MELDSSLAGDPAKLHERIRQLFGLVRTSLTEELTGNGHVCKTDQLAVEATTNTWAVADILRPFVAAVTVGNPLQIKAIAQTKVKTDKIDAQVLANLIRCEYLPTVWTPDAATQKLRQLTTLRGGGITDRSRLKSRVQSLLAQLLVVPPVKVVFCQKGLQWLRTVELPAEVRSAIDLYLRLYEAVDQELRKIDDQLKALAYEDGRAKLLMTLPGVAHGVAMSLLAAFGDIDRFKPPAIWDSLRASPVRREALSRPHHQGGLPANPGHAGASRSSGIGSSWPDRSVLPTASHTKEVQRCRDCHGPQAGDDCVSHAQEQRALPLRQNRRRKEQAHGVSAKVATTDIQESQGKPAVARSQSAK